MSEALERPAPRRSRVFGGVDEAGLGPMLGPLALGFSVFRAPAGSTNLWRTLSGVTREEPGHDAHAFVVADSKVVYTRTPSGFARLESTALGFLSLLSPTRKPPQSAADLVWRTPAELGPDQGDLARHAWYAPLACNLPLGQDGARLELRVERLARAMREARVELLDAGVRVVPEGALNRSFRDTQNKSATHWENTRAVLRRLWEHHGPAGLHLTVDRQGGRYHYGPLLAAAFPEALVELVEEHPSLAQYRVRQGEQRDMHILFAERAEQRSFAVALASCLAKYAREVSMRAFNEHFRELVPGVKPTAGYTQDGRRWLEEARAHLARAGLDPALLVRER